jgi:hypothetical protein
LLGNGIRHDRAAQDLYHVGLPNDGREVAGSMARREARRSSLRLLIHLEHRSGRRCPVSGSAVLLESQMTRTTEIRLEELETAGLPQTLEAQPGETSVGR